ncbi:hypothetical protein EDC04DRAFT_2603664 [Pisolithus marmoratus]|nr:hypothetical protein EDC04DRAFT_2603664 [Pisolithus marmoratus]
MSPQDPILAHESHLMGPPMVVLPVIPLVGFAGMDIGCDSNDYYDPSIIGIIIVVAIITAHGVEDDICPTRMMTSITAGVTIAIMILTRTFMDVSSQLGKQSCHNLHSQACTPAHFEDCEDGWGTAGYNHTFTRAGTTLTRRFPLYFPSSLMEFLFLHLVAQNVKEIFMLLEMVALFSELKLRIDRGYYTLENVNDPHVLTLLKLWLCKLCDPLVPEELHNDCINASPYPPALCYSVQKPLTSNRRVVLFVMSFLQFFLEEKVLASTKMTAANMALVLAPNLQIYQSSTAENGLSNTTCTVWYFLLS